MLNVVSGERNASTHFFGGALFCPKTAIKHKRTPSKKTRLLASRPTVSFHVCMDNSSPAVALKFLLQMRSAPSKLFFDSLHLVSASHSVFIPASTMCSCFVRGLLAITCCFLRRNFLRGAPFCFETVFKHTRHQPRKPASCIETNFCCCVPLCQGPSRYRARY